MQNAPTFLDELQDPAQLRIDQEALSRLEIPVRLTQGSESLPVFPRAIDRLLELHPTRFPRDDRRRSARTAADDPRALRRGHDSGAAAARGHSNDRPLRQRRAPLLRGARQRRSDPLHPRRRRHGARVGRRGRQARPTRTRDRLRPPRLRAQRAPTALRAHQCPRARRRRRRAARCPGRGAGGCRRAQLRRYGRDRPRAPLPRPRAGARPTRAGRAARARARGRRLGGCAR